MKKMLLLCAALLPIFITTVYLLGPKLGLSGSKLTIFTLAMSLIALTAAAVAIVFAHNKEKAEKAAKAPAEQEQDAGTDDISVLVREAESKLASSQAGAKIGALPAVFIVGDTGVSKTSVMINSGLEAELLAGHVYQETSIVPTRGANIWYAKNAVFVEGAGSSVGETGAWGRIARRMQGGRLGTAVGKGGQAPRAALVMLDAESLFRQGAQEQLGATARTLRARLGEITQALGINLPVYVLFTKMDRVPFFLEYVRNLTNEEAAQVFGATLPLVENRQGVYGDQEAARCNEAFDTLFRSLANYRPPFLAREHEPPKLPGIYEFPREFRKLRAMAVQFMVDLCRPNQLGAGPFLRGFYFTGVRPVVVSEVAPVPSRQKPKGDMAATGMFRADMVAQGGQPAQQQVVGSRRVPQWVFLPRLFNDLLLGDRAAMGASGSSTKVSLVRRVLFASAAALCLLYSLFLIVSFVRNRSLESTVKEAAQGIQTVEPGGVKLAGLDSLKRLETLRQSLATLTDYTRNGSPMSYHWGLYVGDELYPQVRKIYFDSFKKVMFGQTQNKLVDILRALPPTPDGGPEYGPTYDTLKAYLITTSHHDKSTREFLSPVLLNRWSAGQTVDAERVQLATRQFDFYADELKVENPYTSANDAAAIAQGRKYLNSFAGVERVYAAMLADAAKNSTPVNFNRQFPGSSETVVNAYEVAGPFTKKGWDFMRNSFKNPEKYFAGEQWVLGDQGAANIDRATLARQLADRYFADFIKQWRNYIKAGQVVKYKDIPDAAKKLNVLSGNTSTLLAMFSLASTNTAVDEPDVARAFQPVQAVVQPNADRFVGPGNQMYMNALLTLQTSMDKAAGAQPLTEQIASATLNDATSAKVTTKQVAQSFRVDPEGRVDTMVQNLMTDPITYAEALLKRFGPDELNNKGKDLCAQYRRLSAKYPFNPSPNAPPASIAEVNSIFAKPEGAIWKFYNESLAKLLPKQGDRYVPAPAPNLTLTPAFVTFWNNAAAVSEMFYAGGTPDPHVNYSLKPIPAEGIRGLSLKLDGQSWSYSGGEAAPKQFTWQAAGNHGAQATVNLGTDLGWSNKDGLWATWQFFSEAEGWQPAGNGWNLEWGVRTVAGPMMLPSGNPLKVKFQLDMGGGPPVFQKGYLSKMVCIADVAR